MTSKIETHNPLSVANLLVEMAIDNATPISNLHLQKVLYYLQAFYLCKTSSPIIDAQFSRWPYGPVIESVHQAFSHYGASAILEPLEDDGIFFEEGSIPTLDPSIFGAFEDTLVPFLKKLFITVPWQLVEKTHGQKIWSDYEKDTQSYSAPDYTEEEILEQFEDIREQIWQSTSGMFQH